jgi:ribokinase
MTPFAASSNPGGPIVVVGSLNMDLVMRLARVPEGGETLMGREFRTIPGGKGANQAVACARMGGQVVMVGQVGEDAYGRILCEGLAADGIDTRAVRRKAGAGTGVALILVEDDGQNRIILDAGANGALVAADLEPIRDAIQGAGLLITQLEVPLPVVARAVALARSAGVPVLLNPAPAAPLPPELLAQVDILVPNESEAALLCGFPVTGLESAHAAGRHLRAQGVGRVLVTLGERGVAVVDADGERHFPAFKVTAVDTTAAGDSFIGGLAIGLAEGLELDAAVALGQRASALCVTRAGAQPSIPYRRELA